MTRIGLYVYVLFLFLLSCSATAQETITVFDPGDTYATTRIPALVVSAKGTLLAFCEARANKTSDWADIDLLLRRSADGGKTWEPFKVIVPREVSKPLGNPTPIVDRDGTIHLLFQRNYARAYYMRSNDDGVTWSEPADITYAFEAFHPEYNWKVLAPGPGHSIQLRSDRLLVPVWLCEPNPSIPGGDHRPSCIATIYSDDHGKTWKRGEIIAGNGDEYKNPSETMALELSDGRVMLNIRNESEKRRRLVTYSGTGIGQWTKPVYDTSLFEPVCMASIIRVPARKKGKSLLVFVNPDTKHLLKGGQQKAGVKLNLRQNLTAKVSHDEGKTWATRKVVEEGFAGYSDLATGADGTLYCLYETNQGTEGWRYRIVLKRFPRQWLTAKNK
jgi:sialidase-1